jgi:hypothetical protein
MTTHQETFFFCCHRISSFEETITAQIIMSLKDGSGSDDGDDDDDGGVYI